MELQEKPGYRGSCSGMHSWLMGLNADLYIQTANKNVSWKNANFSLINGYS
jgi:hypothetical protein